MLYIYICGRLWRGPSDQTSRHGFLGTTGLYLLVYLSVHPSVYLFISPSMYPSIHLSIYTSIHLSIYTSIHLSIACSPSISRRRRLRRGLPAVRGRDVRRRGGHDELREVRERPHEPRRWFSDGRCTRWGTRWVLGGVLAQYSHGLRNVCERPHEPLLLASDNGAVVARCAGPRAQ